MQITERTVRFQYRNWRGETAQRTVTPTDLFFGVSPHHEQVDGAVDANGPQWYLIGWCHDRGAVRHFALRAITGTIT